MAHILSGTTVLRVNMHGAETKPCEKRKTKTKELQPAEIQAYFHFSLPLKYW